jgi:hypothetical protein
MAIAAMIPIIATTISSSIRVNPASFFLVTVLPFGQWWAVRWSLQEQSPEQGP